MKSVERVLPYQYERVGELLLSRLSLTQSMCSLPRELSRGGMCVCVYVLPGGRVGGWYNSIQVVNMMMVIIIIVIVLLCIVFFITIL